MSRLLHFRVPLLVLPILVFSFFCFWSPPANLLRSCKPEVPAVRLSPAVVHLPKVLEYFQFDPRNPQKFMFPEGTKSIVIDIGQHVSPILPKSSSEFVIGFEAILERYKDNVAKNLNVPNKLFIPMAVGKEDGMLMFKELVASEASSLLDVNEDAVIDRLKILKQNNYPVESDPFQVKYKYFIPVTSLNHVIERIPDHISLSFLKIDTQGNEMQVLQGAGPLNRFQSIMAEVTMKKKFYKDSASAAELLTFMKNAGFEPDHEEENTYGEEKNIYFRPINAKPYLHEICTLFISNLCDYADGERDQRLLMCDFQATEARRVFDKLPPFHAPNNRNRRGDRAVGGLRLRFDVGAHIALPEKLYLIKRHRNRLLCSLRA